MSTTGRDVVNFIRQQFVLSEQALDATDLSSLFKEDDKSHDTLVAVCQLMCELVEEHQTINVEQQRAEAEMNAVLQCRSQLLTELMFAASLQHVQIVDDMSRKRRAEGYLRMRGIVNTHVGKSICIKYMYLRTKSVTDDIV